MNIFVPSKSLCKISTPLATDSPVAPPLFTSDNVSCAAGSPIACAASIPTFSPTSGNALDVYFKP